jgi:(2Fe-2S) ferredoxin
LQQRSAEVLAAFQAAVIPGVTVVGSSCLGQCGNGAMVQVLPDAVWYWRVLPAEVPAIVDRHLIKGQPITAMLYPKFH